MLLTVVVAALIGDVPVVVEAGAPPAPAPIAVVLDAPITFTAAPASSSFETVLTPWFGIRAGVRAPLVGPLVAGGEGGVHVGGYERAGTSTVAVTRAFGAIEARGLVGATAATHNVAATGYVVASVLGGAGASYAKVFADARTQPLLTGGARLGVGAEMRLLLATARVELTAGVRDLRPEVATSVAAGLAF